MVLEEALLIAAFLVVLSIFANRASLRTGIPALLLFLLIGMLAGSDGPGGIVFDDPHLSQSVGVIALILILFSGGLDTDWGRVRPVLGSGLALANLGVLISAGVMAGFAVLALGFSPLEGMLLGVIVSSTDAAAVFSVLRARDVNLRGNLEPLIEFESGSNDPMAVFLTVGLTGVLTGATASLAGLIPAFLVQMLVGALVGYGMGRLMIVLINRLRLGQEGLYPVLSLALVLLAYSATALVGGNGFLAVYLAGIVVGNHDLVHKRSLLRFHDGLAWLMQIAMFLTLGLQVFPSRLTLVAGAGLLASLVLIFVARPLSVFVALAFARLSLADKAMVAWIGLRGAVPIVLATYPLLAGLPQADTMFHLVFFIVLTSVLIQGTTIPLVARRLGLQMPSARVARYPQEFVPRLSTGSQVLEVQVQPGAGAAGRSIMELGLPPGVLFVSIVRADETVIPSGATVLEPDDRVLLLAEQSVLGSVMGWFGHQPGAAEG